MISWIPVVTTMRECADSLSFSHVELFRLFDGFAVRDASSRWVCAVDLSGKTGSKRRWPSELRFPADGRKVRPWRSRTGTATCRQFQLAVHVLFDFPLAASLREEIDSNGRSLSIETRTDGEMSGDVCRRCSSTDSWRRGDGTRNRHQTRLPASGGGSASGLHLLTGQSLAGPPRGLPFRDPGEATADVERSARTPTRSCAEAAHPCPIAPG